MVEQPTITLTPEQTELFGYKGKRIETDRKDDKRKDGVLPIYPGSGVHYLIDHLLVKKGDVALDVCTGSGILGIYASTQALKVVGTDINGRALVFAKRNAQRNHLTNIEFRQGDLFKPVQSEQFDFIITNPPFVPIPATIKAALHSNGGPDGLLFVRKIIEQINSHLKPSGRMQLYSLSFGNKEKTLLEDILSQYLRNKKVTMISLYSQPLPIEEFIAAFKQYDTKNWGEELKAKDLTHLYSYIVNIEPEKGLKIVKADVPQNERGVFPDSWNNWKKKFAFWVLT